MSGFRGASESSSDSDDDVMPAFTGQLRSNSMDASANEELPADVFFQADIYDSVMVAAFGGVNMNLDGEDSLFIHPFVPFIFCLPLVFVQAWLTFCVGFALELDEHIIAHDAADRMIMSMKVVLVVVVQLMVFDRMLSSLRSLIFVLNPTTWTDIKRLDYIQHRVGSTSNSGRTKTMASPTRDARCSWINGFFFVMPFPLMALMLKLGIEYWVCLQSTSIILASSNIKEAIFDSLAISFIIELDCAAWKFVATILHLDKFEDFKIRLLPHELRRKANKESYIVKFLPRCMHRGHGARRLENIVTFVIMWLLYMRQVLVVLHAVDTGVLPVSRDLCTYWRWSRGQGRNKFFQFLFSPTFQSSTLLGWSFKDQLAQKADPQLGGICTEKYDRMHFNTMLHLIHSYPAVVTTFGLGVAFFLVVPQLFYSSGAFREALETLEMAVEHKEEATDSPRELHKEISKAADRIEVLEQALETERQEREDLARRLATLERGAAAAAAAAASSPTSRAGLSPDSLRLRAAAPYSHVIIGPPSTSSSPVHTRTTAVTPLLRP